MLITLLALVVLLFASLAIGELTSRSIYGRYLSDEEVIPYLERHLENYSINEVSYNKMLSGHQHSLPFIAERNLSFATSWYISEYGQILRWSKASKLLDEHFNRLYKPSVKKTLADL